MDWERSTSPQSQTLNKKFKGWEYSILQSMTEVCMPASVCYEEGAVFMVQPRSFALYGVPFAHILASVFTLLRFNIPPPRERFRDSYVSLLGSLNMAHKPLFRNVYPIATLLLFNAHVICIVKGLPIYQIAVINAFITLLFHLCIRCENCGVVKLSKQNVVCRVKNPG